MVPIGVKSRLRLYGGRRRVCRVVAASAPTNQATGAPAVLHHHGLAESMAERLARHQVVQLPPGMRQKANGALGLGGLGAACHQQRRQGKGSAAGGGFGNTSGGSQLAHRVAHRLCIDGKHRLRSLTGLRRA